MRRLLCFGFAVAVVTSTLGQEKSGPTQARAVIDTYCAGCHSTAVHAGGLALDRLPLDAIRDHPDVWEKAVRKLRGRLMPPPGSRQPSQADIDSFVTWTESELDRAAVVPIAGHVPMQRMTRTEYATAVNDLLGIELDAETVLPAEIEVDGFNNIAAALSVSPAFLDQYVAAARLAAKQAIGESLPKVASAHYHQPSAPASDQAAHVDGLPLGTRGGMKFRHNFHADGEYRFTIPDLGVDLYTRVVETRHAVIILVDGREVFREYLGGPEDMKTVDRGGAPGRAAVMKRFTNIPIQVKAGTRDVAVTFVERARVESDEFVGFLPGDLFSRGDRMPRLVDGVQVVGPFNSPGVSDTPSRRRVFICRPTQTAAPNEEQACARRIAASLARRAFRRPVTNQEVESLIPFFESGRKGKGGFDAGIEQLIAAVLVSPEFLYRGVRAPERTSGSASVFPLNDVELASRLSFFLWSQGPDDALLDVAAAGKLKDPASFARRRCGCCRIRAPRAWCATSRSSGWTWTTSTTPSPIRICFRPSTTSCGRTWNRARVLHGERAARGSQRRRPAHRRPHVPQRATGEALRHHLGARAAVPPRDAGRSRRWGLLGKGAMLLRTSYGNRTSPVLRGAWVMGKLMGTPPTPPPPDVDTDLSHPKGETPKTLRARLESHRAKPGCRQCHDVIDPIGLALENFDAIGRWRDSDEEAKAPIDAKTVLPNGKPSTARPNCVRHFLAAGTCSCGPSPRS